MRPAAAKIIERADKRLGNCRGVSNHEVMNRAFSLAAQDLPQNRRALGVLKQLTDRDSAREDYAQRQMDHGRLGRERLLLLTL